MNRKFFRQKLKTVERQLSALKAHQFELETQNENLQQIQATLEEYYAYYASLYECAPVSYLVLNHKGNIIEINRAATEFFKDRREDLLHKPFVSFVAEEDRERWHQLFSNMLVTTDESRQNIDLSLKPKDGVIFNACVECLCDNHEKESAPPELHLALTHIFERKSGHQQRCGDERNAKSYHQSSPFGLSDLELETGKMQWRGSIFDIFEINEKNFDGLYQTFLSHVHPEDRHKVDNAFLEAINNKTSYQIEHRLQMADGRIKWVEANCLIHFDELGNAVQSTCMMQDITKKVQLNDLLQINTQQYKAFFDTISCGVMYLDHECRILSANPAAENVLGLTFNKMQGISLLDPRWRTIREDGSEFPPETHPVMQALQTGQRVSNAVLGLWNCHIKDYVWLSVDTIPQYNAGQNTPFAIYACFEDITKRKKIENRLLAAEKRYRALLFGASDAILIIGLAGYIEEMNRSAEKLLGFNKQKVCCIHINDIHPGAELPKIKKYFDDVINRGHIEALETKIVREDNGKQVDIEIHASLIEVDGRVVIQSIFIDITDRKKQEQQRVAKEISMRHALVREVHHRIKNNLQGIMGVLYQFVQNHPETAEPLNQAISQVKSVAIIHGLQGRACASDVRLCELTETIATETGYLWQKTVKIDIPTGWGPYIIAEVEAVPIALILNELISNAIKHSQNCEFIEVAIRRDPLSQAVQISIYNQGQLPENFDDQHSGLNLVALLMPPTGASLSWEQQGNMVITQLELSTPIITFESHP